MLCEIFAHYPPAIVAHDGGREESTSPRLGEGGEDIRRPAARRDTYCHVMGPGVGDELAGEDRLGPYIVGDGRDVG